MIIGVCQKQINEKTSQNIIWDYAACLYPEGSLGPDKTYLFNSEQIEKIYALGYQDEEQFAFKIKADNTIKSLRKDEKNNQKEQM